jgi:SAM-dependent methyltransferase
LSTQQSVSYINRVFEDYLNYGGIDLPALQGRRMLEIGPGDNLGVALRLYAAGASHVVCLDKFFAKRDPETQAKIYWSLRDGLSDAERIRYDQAIDLSGGISINEKAVRYVYGIAAEKADRFLEPESFDLIVSRAVLWEIYDTEGALRTLDRLLCPGGRMIHKIACADWMFRQDGYHPLEFLTIPEPIYKMIARDSGKSNRRTIDYYRRAMQRFGYDAELQITRVVGGEGEEFPPHTTCLVKDVHYTEDTIQLIRGIRPRLLPRFRELCDEDLMVEGMFLVAAKPSLDGNQMRCCAEQE